MERKISAPFSTLPGVESFVRADWFFIYLQLDQTYAPDVKARYRFSLLDRDDQPVPSYNHSNNCIQKFTCKGYWGAHEFIQKRTQLFGPMRENAAVCVWIEGIEAGEFKALLHFVYTDSLPEVGDGEAMAMAQHLLVAADRYSLERLKLICEDKLCNHIDTSTVGTILALAEQHSCHGLKKACLNFLMSGSNLKTDIATGGFEHLTNSCPSVLKELLAKLAL